MWLAGGGRLRIAGRTECSFLNSTIWLMKPNVFRKVFAPLHSREDDPTQVSQDRLQETTLLHPPPHCLPAQLRSLVLAIVGGSFKAMNCLLNCLGRTGSWAGPAWFKMLLGLGRNQGGGVGGGEKGGHPLSVFLIRKTNKSTVFS